MRGVHAPRARLPTTAAPVSRRVQGRERGHTAPPGVTEATHGHHSSSQAAGHEVSSLLPHADGAAGLAPGTCRAEAVSIAPQTLRCRHHPRRRGSPCTGSNISTVLTKWGRE